MKRIILTFLCVATLALPIAAQESISISGVQPKDARTMGMGGAFLSVSPAWWAFYGNPAGFGSKDIDLAVSATVWSYFKPTIENVEGLMEDAEANNYFGMINSLIVPNGFGVGTGLGVGYAGRGLGIGIFVDTDEYIYGPNVLGARGRSESMVSAVLGLSVPIELFGLKLSVGGDIRPFYRVSGAIDSTFIASIIPTDGSTVDVQKSLMNLAVRGGFGLAVDLGATLSLGPLTVGLSVRDISNPFTFAEYTISQIVDALKDGSLPSGGTDAVEAIFLPNITAGVSFNPTMGSPLLDLLIIAEVQDPLQVWKNNEALWALFHVGAEARLLSFVTLRAGLNKGWLSAGVGVKLLFLDVNAAIFTEELGLLPGDKPRSGLSVEAAIRF